MDREAAPKQGDEGSPAAWLVSEPTIAEGLRDLRVGSEIIVLTWLDRASRDVLVVHPRDDLANPERGVFSTRSADRPNPIGLHRVEIIALKCEGAFHLGVPLVQAQIPSLRLQEIRESEGRWLPLSQLYAGRLAPVEQD